MVEKDENIREEIVRNETPETDNVDVKKEIPEDIKKGQTEVKNANAAGLGSMGRNDENEIISNDTSRKQNPTAPY